MYLTSLYLTLNLDTEVSSFDRERVLRSLREKLKNSFGHRITLRTDDDHSIVIAFLEDNLERVGPKCEALISRIDEAGEARVMSIQRQTFAWFDGEFKELRHENSYENVSEIGETSNRHSLSRNGQTIVYADADDAQEPEVENSRLQGTFRRSARRNLRIPIRR